MKKLEDVTARTSQRLRDAAKCTLPRWMPPELKATAALSLPLPLYENKPFGWFPAAADILYIAPVLRI